MARDFQRSKVYAWERQAAERFGFQFYMPRDGAGVVTMDQVAAFVAKVWRSERGRYGKAKWPVPELADGGGTRRASGSSRRLNLPRWSRSPWVMCHEIAHGLDMRSRRGWHGPRFVGVLIGLAARHCGQDADALVHLAEEMGVHVDTRSIGAVPNRTLAAKVHRALPGTATEIATRLNLEQGLGVSYRQVRGAALQLIRQGRARWRGQVLVPEAPKGGDRSWCQRRPKAGIGTSRWRRDRASHLPPVESGDPVVRQIVKKMYG
jgi:hypothetical protein